MFTIKKLYDLQKIDTALSRYETSLFEMRNNLEDNSEVTSAKNALEKLETKYSQLISIRNQNNYTVQDTQARLKLVDTRLYDGSITNPRELLAAQEEQAFIKEQLRNEEDSLLEVMLQIERTDQLYTESGAHFHKVQNDRNLDLPGIMKALEQLSLELDILRKSRADIIPDIPASHLLTYETLLRNRGGQAVAKVERNICQGCRVTLSVTNLQQAKSASTLVHCNSCNRILYLAKI